ncbi:uncharacterized protein A4U43_C10F14040 [Asparagus officinalis]|uniref:Uncharacterized protein n=1 Tax=Asparagus officinalis TaxID=4686 RepID=A0A5P1E5Z4_ASPOF|nr:uncharacterized protein A4U43_C10F14040 [Asparagus officinalis]
MPAGAWAALGYSASRFRPPPAAYPPTDREMVSSNACELNCSPWDLMLLNLDDYFLTNRSEEEGEEGNSGNSIVTEHQEEQKPISTPVITRKKATKAARRKLTDGRDPIRKERRKEEEGLAKGKKKTRHRAGAEASATGDGSVPYSQEERRQEMANARSGLSFAHPSAA